MPLYSVEQLTYLVQLARQVLSSFLGNSLPSQIIDLGEWPPGFVNITLRRKGELCGSMGAHGATLPDAVDMAVRRAARDCRFDRPTDAADLSSTTIEVWIETDRQLLCGDSAGICRSIRMGWDGIRLVAGEHSAYFKPSVALTSFVPTTEQLLEMISRKAGLPKNAWSSPETCIERTTWLHAIESPMATKSILTLRGFRSTLSRRAEPAELRSAACLSAKRMLAVQKDDGSLGYLYNPFRDKWLEGEHRVRLAGSVYALSRAAQHPATCDVNGITAGAARALEFMATQMTPSPNGSGQFVKERNSEPACGKLGATALAALAFEYAAAGSWREQASRLVDTIIALQNADGSFQCFIGQEKTRNSAQNFYPGESLLALGMYAHRTRDERVIRAISSSFRYYSAHFRREPSTAFVLWQTDAWTRIAEGLAAGALPTLAPEGPSITDICSFVFAQVDWLLQFQHTETASGDVPEYLGGFKAFSPPKIGSATYGEAIIRGCSLAALAGDSSRVEKYRQAALKCIEFLLRLQVCPGIEAFFPRPERAIGAATASLESFEMRCDYDQHFLTTCLSGLDTLALWEAT